MKVVTCNARIEESFKNDASTFDGSFLGGLLRVRADRAGPAGIQPWRGASFPGKWFKSGCHRRERRIRKRNDRYS